MRALVHSASIARYERRECESAKNCASAAPLRRARNMRPPLILRSAGCRKLGFQAQNAI